MPAPIRGPFRAQAAAALVCALFSACGGGGGGGGASVSPPTKVGSNATAGPSAAATLSVSFQQYTPVQTSSTKRAPKFVSPATQSIGIAVLAANGTTITNPVATTFNVSPAATGCTTSAGTVTCTASIDAPVGSDVLAITSYAGQNGTGTALGTTQAPATIVQNSTNRIPLSIGGTIANLELFLANPTNSTSPNFTLGTASTSLVVIVPLDASGAVIVNPGDYNPAIALTLSTTDSGAFSLVLDGTPSGSSATVASPNDQAVLAYNGSGTGSISTTVTASAGTIAASGSISASAASTGNFHGTGSGTGFTAATPDQFIFTAAGQSGTLAVSGGIPPYTIVTSSPSIASVAGTSPTFTVSAVGVGSATLTVTDSASTPNHFTYPVTVDAPPISIGIASCGTSASCTSTKMTFPQYTSSGVTPQETGTIALEGGTGTYTYYFASSGTTTSSYVNVAQSGNMLTITPTGDGNETLVITSGAQTAVYPIVTSTASPLAALLPTAMGLVIMENTGGVPKTFSLTLPSSVTSFTQTGGATDNNFAGPPGQPGLFTSTPMTPGNGSVQFADASGNVANVLYTIFGVTFSSCTVNASTVSCAHGGASNPLDLPLPSPQDEQMNLGETDAVTITGMAGTLSATTGNTTIVTASASGSTVTVNAVGVGATIVSISDSATGATATYTVSVTSTTIPVASRSRQ
jgi:hypothetical protein